MAKIHEHGSVELLELAGGEIDIVNAARVSFASESHHEQVITVLPNSARVLTYKLSDKDKGLINYLMKHKHGTPFEMIWTKWRIKAPIFVFREWHRHRTASINEMSGRYVELKNEFYVPEAGDYRTQVGRPGHYYYEPLVDHDEQAAEAAETIIKSLNVDAWDQYQNLLRMGVAKEQARLVLPVSIYSEMIWATNLRGLLNFLSLRNDDRAQREIHDYAAIMESIIARQLPTVFDSFSDNGRTAP